MPTQELDVIVVGSGPAGATVARDLSRRGARVLILERGSNAPVKESFLTLASLLHAVPVGDKLTMPRARTTGGTSSVYFGVAQWPPLETFRALGVDLSNAIEDAKRELPLTVLPDEVIGAQTRRARASALNLGYPWAKRLMLVDLTKCASGYTYECKWTARDSVQDAVAHGASLVNRARVTKVLTDRERAAGVEYIVQNGKQSETRRVFAPRVVLAAGSAVSPVILRNSGLRGIAERGFCCHPTVVVSGTVKGMKAGETFTGSEGADLPDDISVGDANLGRTFYRMSMLANRRPMKMLQYPSSLALGVMIRDAIGGSLRSDDRFHKELTQNDLGRLQKGEQIARGILKDAGAKDVFSWPMGAGDVGATIRLREDVDGDLQTEIRNLHVCDGSLIPESLKISPTLPLICLGKYLANRLAPRA